MSLWTLRKSCFHSLFLSLTEVFCSARKNTFDSLHELPAVCQIKHGHTVQEEYKEHWCMQILSWFRELLCAGCDFYRDVSREESILGNVGSQQVKEKKTRQHSWQWLTICIWRDASTSGCKSRLCWRGKKKWNASLVRKRSKGAMLD